MARMTKAEKEIYLKQRLVEMQEYENDLKEKGYRFIAGVDEVGRGPLAGPVVTAAVVLPDGFDVLGRFFCQFLKILLASLCVLWYNINNIKLRRKP